MRWSVLLLLPALAPGCRTEAPPPAASGLLADSAADSGGVPADCAPPPIDGSEPGAAPAFTLAQAPRNLLILSVDTLRRDHLGRYGGGAAQAPASPTMDALMASGLVLDDHRSCSDWTLPSMLCALTGRGFLGAVGSAALADRLMSQGFRVGLASANTWLHGSWPSGDAYDYYFVEPVDGEEIVSRTLSMAQDLLGGPERWFIQAHFLDPHAPYEPDESYLAGLEGLPPIPWDLTSWMDTVELEDAWPDLPPESRARILKQIKLRYAAEVRQQDDMIAELLDGLDALGALDDTLILFMSDHGEQLFDRGELQHGQRLFQEESAAVAAFVAPGLEPMAWTEPTTHADLVPTILYALGLPQDPGDEGLIVGTARADRPRFADVVMDDVRQSVDVGSVRLQLDWETGPQLFDRASDPGETVNLWDPADPEQQAIWAILEPRIEALDCKIQDGSLGWP